MSNNDEPVPIGIIGGSGLYEMDGFSGREERVVTTPFGAPSETIVGGWISGRRVYFLPRHGRGHRILPTEINHRANIYALRSLGVRFIIAVSACGSLQEQYPPCHIVLPDQFYDRTSRREHHTFFGNGIVAHIGFADPISTGLRHLLHTACLAQHRHVHNGGTYVNMDGPAFSTRAESAMHRMLGADVIGMTNAPEARLCREAEIAAATLALVTDYDCWKQDEAAVEVDAVIENLHANTAMAKAIIHDLIARIPETPDSPSHRALDTAIFTDPAHWPAQTAANLAPILARYLADRADR